MSVMVITGGTAGAGKATALRFARAGYHVALIARDETGLLRGKSFDITGKRWDQAGTRGIAGMPSFGI